jgi:nucleoside-diphosphate-sugar epimerase
MIAARQVRSVLVTGGAGYIGSTLVRGLLSDGLRVRVLDSLLRGDAGIRALYTNPDFELLRGDVRRPEAVVRAVSGVDAVIHLAAAEGERVCRANSAAAIETNVEATALLAEVCRGLGVARLALASTLEVYGRSNRHVDETAEPEPAGLYAATKLDAERLALSAAADGPATVAFRMGEVFGVVGAADDQDDAESPRAGARYRTHVADVCAVIRQALVCRAEVVAGQIFNVGETRMCHSDAEIAALLADLALDEGRGAEAPSEDPGPVISFEKLRTRFGAACLIPLRQGLSEMLAHRRRQGATLDVRRAPESLPAGLRAGAAARFVA